MFDLLKEDTEVIDAPDAIELDGIRGGIEFTNVTFGYVPERIILKNISFSVPPGKTVGKFHSFYPELHLSLSISSIFNF